MIAPTSPLVHGLRLRPVDLSDAAFIIAQRTHPRAVRFLGDTSSSKDAQQQWIAAQRERPKDAYWICENAAAVPLGTIGVYDVQGARGEWGRFVVRPGSKAAPGSLLLALTMAFETMHLTDVICTTVASNSRAIALYERAGMRLDEIYAGSVTLAGQSVPTVMHRLTPAQWPHAKDDLNKAAESKAFAVANER